MLSHEIHLKFWEKKTLKIMCKEAFFGMAIILDPCLGIKTS